MSSYIISELAREDLIKIWEFIAEDNQAAADKVIGSIQEKFEMLSCYPKWDMFVET
ncbi:MAG: type II toxin-antitoxin system RelE/ParE family toxin [Proteobacteria bacterium]|nr:type II toxin-antitoxin system RelE/ParE family toxin [Pseudomonadota bacterium]